MAALGVAGCSTSCTARLTRLGRVEGPESLLKSGWLSNACGEWRLRPKIKAQVRLSRISASSQKADTHENVQDKAQSGPAGSNGKSAAKSNGKSNGNGQMPSGRPVQKLTGGSLEEAVPGLRRTVWDQQDLRPTYPTLNKNLRADVVVVGAGIAGLSVAYNLVKAGKKVVVLEAKCIGSGQTGKTTAHLMPWNDDYYMMLEQLFGLKNAALVGDSHRKAIDWVENIVKEEEIDCEFSRVDGYLFPHDDANSTYEMLFSEYDAAKRAGFDTISIIDGGGDPSLGSMRTAIKWPMAADFHPLKYISGLAAAIEKMGGQIFEQSRVMNQEGTKVSTTDRFSVSADAVVLATNSPINHNLAVHARQPADRSYVIGLKVKKGDIKKAQWWDTFSPYHYVRLEEKEGFDVLVVGGMDHPVGIPSTQDYPAAYEDLEKWAKKRWPAAGEIIYKWTGMVYKPVDLLGLYHHDPLNFGTNTYIATGDSGQGMTGGTIAGLVLSDLLTSRQNPWSNLYNASRPPPPHPSVLQSVATATAHTVQGYAKTIPGYGNDFVSINRMSPGSGAVINQRLDKIAVYKDEYGVTTKFSAICPHLKCAVSWNPKDSTFDCPCHGSQFDTKGRCIQGPAKANLPIVP